MEFKEIISLFLSVYVTKNLKFQFLSRSINDNLLIYDKFMSDVLENQGDNKDNKGSPKNLTLGKDKMKTKKIVVIRSNLGTGFLFAPLYPLFLFSQKKISSYIPQFNSLQVISMSMAVSFTSTFLMTPVETIESYSKLNRFTEKASGVVKTTMGIINNHGFKKLWAGASFYGVKLAGYMGGITVIHSKAEEAIVEKKIIPKSDNNVVNALIPVQTHIASGITTGLIVALITHPFDLTYSLRHSSNTTLFRSNWDLVKMIYRSKGIFGFGTGFKNKCKASIVEITVLTGLIKLVNYVFKKN